MSALVERAIDCAGLTEVRAARHAGALSEAHVVLLRQADLLAVGALADGIRADEVGVDVRIYTSESREDDPSLVVLPRADRELTGLELLREVAIARVIGPRRARVRVDWTSCGLELAQVALGFGADELAGRISSKRGLPIAAGELAGVGKRSRLELAHVMKQRELAGYIRRAGRIPVFVRPDGRAEVVAESTTLSEAT